MERFFSFRRVFFSRVSPHVSCSPTYSFLIFIFLFFLFFVSRLDFIFLVFGPPSPPTIRRRANRHTIRRVCVLRGRATDEEATARRKARGDGRGRRVLGPGRPAGKRGPF